MAPFFVIILRLFIPIFILRWPFWGILAAIAADAADVIILDAFGWGFFAGLDYHAIDKTFDMYYLAYAAWVSMRWKEVMLSRTALLLFFWRFAGVVLFEITHIRQVIFFAPSIFENFFLIIAGLKTFFPRVSINTKTRLFVVLAIAAIPKIAQEYVMHYLEFPTWAFIKYHVFRWR